MAFFVVLVPILNGGSAPSSETEVRNVIEKLNSAQLHEYLHQLNGRKLLVVFDSAIRKGL
jgi:hypothetical protein